MKKIAVLLLAIALLVLAGCKCEHKWLDADCLNPQKCQECGETQGEALGHDWQAATCEAPKTCKVCGETEGDVLPHSWVDATCTAPKTCEDCGKTEGEALGHNWVDATYDAPKTCQTCGEVEGVALTRADLGFSMEEMPTYMDAAMQTLGYKLSYWGVDEDGWPTYDLQDANGNYTNVYVSFAPNADSSKVYAVVVICEDVTNTDAVTLMGIVGGVGIGMAEPEFDTEKMQQTFSGTPVVQDNVAYYTVEDHGLTVEMNIDSQFAAFWVYPAE